MNVARKPFISFKCEYLVKTGIKHHCEAREVVVYPGGCPSEGFFSKNPISVG